MLPAEPWVPKAAKIWVFPQVQKELKMLPRTPPPPHTHPPHTPTAPQPHTKCSPLVPKTAKKWVVPQVQNSSKCSTNGSTALNTTTHHTHATQKNPKQTPPTQLDTHRQNHTHALTAKHMAKYSKYEKTRAQAPGVFFIQWYLVEI